MKNETQRDKLIEAICNLDMSTINELMDGDVLHFGCYKNGAIIEIKSVFNWIRKEFSEYTMEAMPWDCEKHSLNPPMYENIQILWPNNKHFHLMISPNLLLPLNLCKKSHKNPVRFIFCQHNFIWDITETKNGKYKLDVCDSYIGTDYYQPEIFGFFRDFRPEFMEDEGVLKTREDFKKLLWPVNSGEVVFWFPEDLKKWHDSLPDVDDSLYSYFDFHCFNKEFKIMEALCTINDTVNEDFDLQLALEEYEKLEDGIIIKYAEFYDKYYIIIEFFNPEILDLSQINMGYFTLNPYPNLRFSSRGFSLFLTFVEKIIKPYNQQKKILCTLLPLRKKENECNENELEIPY